MPDVNIMEHINADTGDFADTFKDQIVGIAGEEFKGTKVFDDVPNLSTLVKNYAHTKTAFGKKLEGVIQRPKEDASEEDKTAFRNGLLTELGASDKPDDYVFPEVEGMAYHPEVAKEFQNYFVENKYPVGMANSLIEKWNETQVSLAKAQLEAQQAQHEADYAELEKDPKWTGDKMVENGRTVFAAIMDLCEDKDLQSLLTKSKINDDPGNHQKWTELGFDTRQRRIWLRIGTAMKSAVPPPNEEGGPADSGNERPVVGPKGIYDHPTSKELAPKT